MTNTEVHPVPKTITLESVKAQFDSWRATRARGHRIPKHLWKAAKNLSKQYDTKQIASELKINPQRLSAKIMAKTKTLRQKTPCPPKPSVKNEFVELSLSPLSPPFTSFEQAFPQGTLELRRPDGTILKASGITHNGFNLNALIKSLCDQ
ncbi:MAG TPA: hypothetical protein VJL87_01510 [Bdellovibrionota bacterium]|nr:hypothetical protein [Bdellovibrionota bacterium]